MMKEIKNNDPETWEALSSETFGVNKSTVPFTTLFVDQNLEQKIKEIKGIVGVGGITQNEDTLNRFFLTATYITKIMKDFVGTYCGTQDNERSERSDFHSCCKDKEEY